METTTDLKVKYGFDVARIVKNAYISEKEVNEILQTNYHDKNYGFAKLSFIDWLNRQISTKREDGTLDQYLVAKQEDWGIIFLGGVDAVRYHNSRSENHIKNAKKQNKSVFKVSPTDITHTERDEYQYYLQEAKIREEILSKTTKVYS